jgi:peptide/nickel transport system substrate-binding protein
MYFKPASIRLLITIALAIALVAAFACDGGEEGEDEEVDTGTGDGAATSAGDGATTAAGDGTAADMGDVTINRNSPPGFKWDGPMPSTFQEAPILAALVAKNELPPVTERLPVPSDVMVVPVVDRIGDYGGTWRRGFTGPNDMQNVERILHDHVIYYDLDGATLVPHIVKGWDVSADGKVYTFNLREGAKWSDGEPFTADDFVFAYEDVILNTDINPERNGKQGYTEYAPVIAKVDDYTVRWTFPEAVPGFLDDLGGIQIAGPAQGGFEGHGPYQPAHYLKQFHPKYTDQAKIDKMMADDGFDNWPLFFKTKASVHRSDVPTMGPWMMTSPNTTQQWVLERNPYYWAVDPNGNQLPYIDKIVLTLAGEKEVLNLRAIAGDYDFQHRHIDLAKVPTFNDNAERGNYRMGFWPSNGNQASLEFNQTWDADPEVAEWLQNKDFRQALAVSIDRELMNEAVFLGTGRLKNPVYNPKHAMYPGDEIESRFVRYDVAEANAKLDEIGLDEKDSAGRRLRSDGKPLVVEVTYIENYFLDYESIAEITKTAWEAVGIGVTLNAEDVNLFAGKRPENEHQIVVGSAGMWAPPLPYGLSGFAPRISDWINSDGQEGIEPTGDMKRLVEIGEEVLAFRYGDRKALYTEAADIIASNQYYIGLVGDTPAFNGVIVIKNNFKNVPDVAPNVPHMQNPGIARTEQFFLEGGKNDSE